MGRLRSNPVANLCCGLAAKLVWFTGHRSDATTILWLRSQLDDALAREQEAVERVRAIEAAAEIARARQMQRLAVVAHELRNPLAPMRNAAAILTCNRPEETQRARLVIERQITLMTRIIDDLIDVSRANAGKLCVVLGRVSLHEIIECATEACSPVLDKRRQRLLISGCDQGCELNADRLRLLQVLTNLIDNASKYSPDGYAIRLEINPSESQVALSVTDEGIGIPAEALDHVFEPFMQEARAADFDRSGLGVGLAVVRELVEAHSGEVAVTSEGIGRGARFVVTLPRSGQAST